MKNEARKRGGRCLSTTFKTVHHHLEWECSFGHKWKAPTRHVFGYMKSWCGDCGVSYAERMCKIAFESIFKKPFPKCRPDWLKNETGKNLELDGYCRALRLAFEYDGEQHFKIRSFKGSETTLSNIVKHDEIKNMICSQNSITLIRINYKDNLSELASIIKSRNLVLVMTSC